ncbi:hypothetical protein BV22DRAFT_1054634 [Leucogyrophana mollusca]|uniref:Uncharacterized protein n=1 Tax=Leucogyrophana mollusca TaxID=85980 RepID=A0ACB8BYM4_9AGAM|nr:hypothetical protein BV22DRAFT_1054634 [Leucogyrophana mollusca]
MVSALWEACSEGNLDNVLGLLNDGSAVDLEIRDHNGVTPLIEAVKNGHVEVVRVLLDRGADPSFSSTQTRPEQFTSDSAILEMISAAQNKYTASGVPAHDQGYPHDQNGDPSKRYYPIPPGPYGYYPNMRPPTMPDGSPVYYQHPSMQLPDNGGLGNLPPPEVARFIPCRYYPACRYGASCMFAHPQAPYYPGPPPPPSQYPAPYDPMTQQPYTPNYYSVPPPSFHPPGPVPSHMNTVSPPSGPIHTPPHPPMVHARTGSEALSPVQVPFSPSSAPPPVPYGPMSPVSPSYAQQGHAPLPLSIPALPPPHQPPATAGPQSPQSVYPNGPVSAPPFAVRQDVIPPYQRQPLGPHPPFVESNNGPKSPSSHPQADGYGNGPLFRQGMTHNRRGSMRRGSFGGRKPACLFYPSGRCRNGDDCRFPHVLSDTQLPQPVNFPARGIRPRDGANGIGTIEEKFANMAVREEAPRRNGTAASSRSQSTDNGSRSRGIKSNGPRVDRKPPVRQRVPNADEFPVLGGSTTPPSRSSVNGGPPVNGHVGPTAAQVLQAPPPFRRESTKDATTRSASPEQYAPKSSQKLTSPVQESQPVPQVNGVHHNGAPSDAISMKLPVSFAAAATSVPEAAREVSVSA